MSKKKEKKPLPLLPHVALEFKRYYRKHRFGVDHINVLAKVTSRKSATRRPLNLCVVLDTSLSMMRYIQMVRDALVGLVNMMKATDKFHLVTFGSDANIVLQEVVGGGTGLVKAARDAVKSVEAGGLTNMIAGLELGKKVLLESQKIDSEAKAKKDFVPIRRDYMMFVFCDGIVNKDRHKVFNKERSTKDIQKFVMNMSVEMNVTVSSFGFTSAFDTDFMVMISEAGAGNYYHVDGTLTSKEETNKIKICFETEFHLASTARIEKSVLKITPMNQSVITKIFGFPDWSIQDGIPLGRLFDDDSRNILIQAQVFPVHDKPAFKVELHGLELGVSQKVELLIEKQFKVQRTDDKTLLSIKSENVNLRSQLNSVFESGDKLQKMIESNSGGKDAEIKKLVTSLMSKVDPLRKELVEARYVYIQLEKCLEMFKDDPETAIKLIRQLQVLRTQTLNTIKKGDGWGTKSLVVKEKKKSTTTGKNTQV